MPLNFEQVATGYLLTAGRAQTHGEAEKKAEMLWSREELLAVLVLREGVFDRWPDLKADLKAVATRSYIAPTTPRAETEDIVVLDALRQQTAAMIEQLVASELERIALTDGVHDVLRRQVLSWADPATHPGYHFCVAHEPRE